MRWGRCGVLGIRRSAISGVKIMRWGPREWCHFLLSKLTVLLFLGSRTWWAMRVVNFSAEWLPRTLESTQNYWQLVVHRNLLYLHIFPGLSAERTMLTGLPVCRDPGSYSCEPRDVLNLRTSPNQTIYLSPGQLPGQPRDKLILD